MTKKTDKEFVLARSVEAGVHCGWLENSDNGTVTLSESRCVWRWYGANTLNELALNGADKSSRISEPVSKNTIYKVVQVVPCTEKARKNLQDSRWGS